jgi:C-terminal processing protease CtpA/Prc
MKTRHFLFFIMVATIFIITIEPNLSAASKRNQNNGNDNGKNTKSNQKLTPAINKEALVVLQDLIDQEYAYRDELNVNWDNLFRVFGPRMVRTRTPKEFADQGANLFKRSGDPQIWLSFKDGDKNGVNGSLWWAFEPNYNMKYLEQKVPNWKKINDNVCVGSFSDSSNRKFGYILINGWPHDLENPRSPFAAAFAALEIFKTTQGLIIDIRPSFGGSEETAAAFAGCFVEKSVVYARHADRIRGHVMRFDEPKDHVLVPNKDHPLYTGEVVVLIGQQNVDASEFFCLMMKQIPRCTLIGTNTRGSSDYKHGTELGNGVNLVFPNCKVMKPDGSVFQGKGITPDLTINVTKAELKKNDPLLFAALQVLSTDQAMDKQKLIKKLSAPSKKK